MSIYEEKVPFTEIRDIEWETDEPEDGRNLPHGLTICGVKIPEDDIADFLSDRYGFLVRSFSVEYA